METTQTWKIGDCLELMQEYPDNHFDLILTDPPYGIASRRKLAKPTDYGHYTWDNERITKKYFDEMIRISKNQIIFGGNYYTDYLYPTSCWIVWDKDNGMNDFADCELAWTSFKTATRLHKYQWHGMFQGNMKKKEKRVHPTQKPLPLFTWIVEKYSKKGNLICDPFLGSGTTLAACRLTNRNCIGFEISDEWEKYYPNRILAHNKKISEWF
jgi:site-specific DNA-methyltransferase (adenine-specific)